jgi:hypothetical protein
MEGLSPGDFPANPIEKAGYRLEFHDEFDGQRLDPLKWFPYYLPHWSARERAAPQYTMRDGCLVLQITEEQQPWCPEFDGGVKASSIQTGAFAGPLGSAIGQHRFNPQCRVRETQENLRLYTPQYGYFEMRARGVRSRGNHVALWMIGYEDAPERSGEIAVFEIMGAYASPESARVGHGVRKWGDDQLRDAFLEPYLPIDAARWHVYALEWRPERLDFYVDGVKISTVAQSPDYPMQFMVSLYELPTADADDEYPKEFAVDYFRAYQPVGGYEL